MHSRSILPTPNMSRLNYMNASALAPPSKIAVPNQGQEVVYQVWMTDAAEQPMLSTMMQVWKIAPFIARRLPQVKEKITGVVVIQNMRIRTVMGRLTARHDAHLHHLHASSSPAGLCIYAPSPPMRRRLALVHLQGTTHAHSHFLSGFPSLTFARKSD